MVNFNVKGVSFTERLWCNDCYDRIWIWWCCTGGATCRLWDVLRKPIVGYKWRLHLVVSSVDVWWYQCMYLWRLDLWLVRSEVLNRIHRDSSFSYEGSSFNVKQFMFVAFFSCLPLLKSWWDVWEIIINTINGNGWEQNNYFLWDRKTKKDSWAIYHEIIIMILHDENDNIVVMMEDRTLEAEIIN